MKCFTIAAMARLDQIKLNQIIVGKVFTVEDQIKETLVHKAIMYSHQICVSKRSPGIIMNALVIKAKNSTVLGLSQ
jgi:hypothetical protein